MDGIASSSCNKSLFLIALLVPRVGAVSIDEGVKGTSSVLGIGLRGSLDDDRSLPDSREEVRRLAGSIDVERLVCPRRLWCGSLGVDGILLLGSREEDLEDVRLAGSLDEVLLVAGSREAVRSALLERARPDLVAVPFSFSPSSISR
jgi:hypothetical protein